MPKLTDEKILDIATGLTEDFKNHWDVFYKGVFKDYRRMAAGGLPQKMADDLLKDIYRRRSKLTPRLVPDAIAITKGTIQHNLFHRKDTFQFYGANEEDHRKADNLDKVVQYGWATTKAETVCGEILEDTLEIGFGLGEYEHWKDKRQPQRQYPINEWKAVTYKSENEVVYDGPRLKYLRPEMTYIEPVRRFDDITAYAKLLVVPISTLRRESLKGGLYFKYRNNVKDLKAQQAGFDPNLEYDVDKEATATWIQNSKIPDFKVLVAEVWMRIAEGEYDIPQWRCVTIGNYNQDPKILRNDIDPLESGKSPLVMCRAFPRNNRLVGFAVPEMVMGLLMEKWAKRNQRVDYANQMIFLSGMLIAPPNSIKKNPILADYGKILELTGSYSADSIKSITMDSRPITTSLNEEMVIDSDVQKTLNTNEISSGYNPGRREAATTNAIINENAKLQQAMPIKAVEDSLIIPTAMAFAQDFQNFSDPNFVIRITGERGKIIFMNMDKSAILGNFDVRCRASSEVIPKSLKQAMYAQFVSQYAANPKVNVDWNMFAKEHLRVMELDSIADIVIKDMAFEMQNIEREEALMLAGFPWEPLMHEPHDIHLVSHLGKRKELQDGSNEAIAFDTHNMKHQQMMAQINGQMNMPNGNNVTDTGQSLDNNMAMNAPKVMGNA